jgi:hypothetical protein
MLIYEVGMSFHVLSARFTAARISASETVGRAGRIQHWIVDVVHMPTNRQTASAPA